MFTSRAEHRLILRIDNADLRLTPLGREIGLVEDDRWRVFSARAERLERNRQRALNTKIRVRGATMPVAQAIARPDVPMSEIVEAGAEFETGSSFESFDLATIEAEFRYAGYLKRHDAELSRVRAQTGRAIPERFSYDDIPGLSREVVQRLSQVRPTTIGQAGRVPGVTPAALAIVASRVARLSKN
jgi:tRNA uridine 5-carboxymethylaminomethyl modification enzyme